MQIIDNIPALREARKNLKRPVGLVPTMGALHEGHLSLVENARENNESVIATIFVNPTQFSPTEDLSSYPRDLDGDLAKLEAAGVDLVFTPTPDLMYPPGHQTAVSVTEVTQMLEGARRPGHFQGVATIVAKLFNLTQPDAAYFGQKDAQQVVVIKQMVRDLNFPLKIVVCPTVREKDGLAMSSRNAYLGPDERKAARVLYRSLWAAALLYEDGDRHPDNLRALIRSTVEAESLAMVDYISVADARTLVELHSSSPNPVLVSLTVQVGKPHLLDNVVLPYALNDRDGLTRALGVAWE